MEILLIRGPGSSLIPADEQGAQIVAGWPLGRGIRAKVTRVRNIRFHRKAFALLHLAFDLWEPEDVEYQGEKIKKEFNRFRKDIIILAGFGNPVVNLKGEVRIEPRSLSFASMEEDEFSRCYKAILDVVWTRIFAKCGYKSPQEVEAIVARLMGFE